jgi:hypothetical protein
MMDAVKIRRKRINRSALIDKSFRQAALVQTGAPFLGSKTNAFISRRIFFYI